MFSENTKYSNMVINLKNRLFSMSFATWSVPVALFFLCLVSFGLSIPYMGFYWDDWETILISRLYPVSEFWNYFSSNRPMAAWTYVLFTPILGSGRLNWHLFSLLLRWLSVLSMWWFLLQMWPKNRRQVTYCAFLFAVYPTFIQQPIVVSYHQHWLGYILFFISMIFMVFSFKQHKYYILYTTLSLLAIVLHLMIFEYFAGVELLRIIILWILIAREENKFSKRLSKTLKYWVPYFLVLLLFILWRVNYSTRVEMDTNRPVLIFQFLSHPLSTIRLLTEMAGKDLIYVFFSCWHNTLEPDLVDLFNTQSIIVWILVFFSFCLLFYYLLGLKIENETNDDDSPGRWLVEAPIVGLIAVLLGLLPIWVTDRLAYGEGLNVDRFAMVAMFGASVVLVAVVDGLIQHRAKVVFIICILTSLAIGLHLRVGNDYRYSWDVQSSVYWQLYWRAPSIEPQTTFLSHGQLFPYVMPTFSFNLLYLEPEDPQKTSYWFYLLERQFQQDSGAWLEGKEIHEEYREFSYSANTKDSLLISNSYGKCMWLLSSTDAEIPELSDLERQALSLSNVNLIKDRPSTVGYPPVEIFGKEPEHGWCYYFQKAELARQSSDWLAIAELGQQARENGYYINNQASNSAREWLPFIEAYANIGQWQDAVDLTIFIIENQPDYQNALLKLWHRIADEAPDTAGMDEALQNVFSKLTESE